MRRRFSGLIIASLLCCVPFLAYCGWNWIRRGEVFLVGDGPLDAVMNWADVPGSFIATLFVLVVYGNIHHYNLYVAEAVQVVANGLFYGCLFWGVWRIVKCCFHLRHDSTPAA
jgi:hypothetical protein